MGKEDTSTLNVFDVSCLCCVIVTTPLHSLIRFSLFCFIIVALHIRHGRRQSRALSERCCLRARGLRKEREGGQEKKEVASLFRRLGGSSRLDRISDVHRHSPAGFFFSFSLFLERWTYRFKHIHLKYSFIQHVTLVSD